MKIAKIQTYQEGPWFYRRGDNYYLAFASTCCPEGIGYAMSTAPTGPWTYKGSIMDGNSQSSGNHPGIIDYKGSSYVFGFNYEVQLQREKQRIGERRSICVEKMTYNADGTIPKLPFWSKTGPAQIEPLNPYVQTEAETIAWAWDVKTETCSEGGMDVTAIENGDYIKVKGVDFGGGATSLDVRVASAGSGGNIEVRLDSQTGKLVGTCAVSGTGGSADLGDQDLSDQRRQRRARPLLRVHGRIRQPVQLQLVEVPWLSVGRGLGHGWADGHGRQSWDGRLGKRWQRRDAKCRRRGRRCWRLGDRRQEWSSGCQRRAWWRGRRGRTGR